MWYFMTESARFFRHCFFPFLLSLSFLLYVFQNTLQDFIYSWSGLDPKKKKGKLRDEKKKKSGLSSQLQSLIFYFCGPNFSRVRERLVIQWKVGHICMCSFMKYQHKTLPAQILLPSSTSVFDLVAAEPGGVGWGKKESDWGWRSNALLLTGCHLQTGVPTHPNRPRVHELLTCKSH